MGRVTEATRPHQACAYSLGWGPQVFNDIHVPTFQLLWTSLAIRHQVTRGLESLAMLQPTKAFQIFQVGPQVGAVRRGLCGAKYGEVPPCAARGSVR